MCRGCASMSDVPASAQGTGAGASCHEAMSAAPEFSFVIPAYNEAKALPATLEAIRSSMAATGRSHEVVVADDGSTDATAAIATASGARVVPVHYRQIARTRNAGARAARGDKLVFVDADTRVNETLLRAAFSAFDAGAVGGGARPKFEAGAPLWSRFAMRLVVGPMAMLRLAAGCFVFVRRAPFEAVGGFDERHFAGEEIMLSMAMKRQGEFVILREGLVTSPRKLMARGPWETAWLVIRLLARGVGGVRKRDHAHFWYDGKR